MTAPKIPKSVLAAFYLNQAVSALPLGDGMINTTYVVTAAGAKTVLQKLSEVFDDSMAQDYAVVSEHLRHQGWEVPTAIPAQGGQAYIKDEAGNWWRAFSFIESDGVTPKTPDLAEVGVLLARLHASLQKLNYQPQFGIPHLHETSYYLSKLTKLQAQLSGEAKALAKRVLDAYHGLPTQDDKHLQLIHGDPRTSNMLFRGGHPFTYIDFDTLMQASVLVDIGDLLRSIVEDAVESRQTFTIEQLRPLVEAYRQESVSAAEKHEFFAESIVAAQRITIELAARFLIDIVEDYYFAWDPNRYPSRKAFNLARAQLQWVIHTNMQGATRV